MIAPARIETPQVASAAPSAAAADPADLTPPARPRIADLPPVVPIPSDGGRANAFRAADGPAAEAVQLPALPIRQPSQVSESGQIANRQEIETPGLTKLSVAAAPTSGGVAAIQAASAGISDAKALASADATHDSLADTPMVAARPTAAVVVAAGAGPGLVPAATKVVTAPELNVHRADAIPLEPGHPLLQSLPEAATAASRLGGVVGATTRPSVEALVAALPPPTSADASSLVLDQPSPAQSGRAALSGQPPSGMVELPRVAPAAPVSVGDVAVADRRADRREPLELAGTGATESPPPTTSLAPTRLDRSTGSMERSPIDLPVGRIASSVEPSIGGLPAAPFAVSFDAAVPAARGGRLGATFRRTLGRCGPGIASVPLATTARPITVAQSAPANDLTDVGDRASLAIPAASPVASGPGARQQPVAAEPGRPRSRPPRWRAMGRGARSQAMRPPR